MIKRACDENRLLRMGEIVECYENTACQNFGIHYHWSDGTDQFVPYADLEMENKARQWFLRTVGILVSRGYLLIVPTIQDEKEMG